MTGRFLICLLTLALPLFAAERRVVFAVVTNDRWAIEPVVMLDPLEKPEESVLKAGNKHALLLDGKDIGTVRVGERVQLGCVSIAAKAELDPDRAVGERFLAANFRTRAAGSVRDPSEDERAMLLAYARRYLRVEKGLEHEIYIVDRGDGDPLAFASVITFDKALTFIARVADLSPRRVAPLFLRAQPRDPDGSNGREPLIGLLDLDADGLAEIVTHLHHKEGYNYVVYRLRGGRWTAFFGGETGC